jgi:hypothetical protein
MAAMGPGDVDEARDVDGRRFREGRSVQATLALSLLAAVKPQFRRASSLLSDRAGFDLPRASNQ